jgi:hypothetical protein
MLTLHIFTADYIHHSLPVAEYREKMTKEQGMAIIKMYARTLGPLSKLRENGLSQVFVNLAWPFEHTRSRRWNPTKAREQNAYMHKRIERLVMGDEYDSSVVRRRGPGNHKSQWLQQPYADPMSS